MQHAPNQTQPLISIVMPNYNCLDYLPQALHSIEQQTYQQLEVIVVDDGSDDGSLDWLSEQALHNPGLQVIKTSRMGPAAARNVAIQAARGDFIAFLDADDSWQPGKLAAQVHFHQQHPDIMFSFTDYDQVNGRGASLGKGFAAWERFRGIAAQESGYRYLQQPFAVLFDENPVSTSSVMVRAEVLKSGYLFDETLPSAEDVELWLRLASAGPVGFTDRCEVDYLVRPDSESSKFDQRMLALSEIDQRYLASACAIDRYAANRSKARLAAARGQQHRINSAYGYAFGEHLKAFMLTPSRLRFKALLVDLKNTVSR